MSTFGFLERVKHWRLLPPKDREFYDLFNDLASTLVDAAKQLVYIFDTQGSERHEIATKIETQLLKCNEIGDAIEELLLRSQQPPFERPVISDLVTASFRTMRFINHASNRYVIYDFPSSDKEMRELAPIILEACQQIKGAIESLPKNRSIERYCRTVDDLENKADEIYHEGLRRRFHEIRADRVGLEERLKTITENSTVMDLAGIVSENVEYTRHVAVFFILRQVYAELERAIDSCTDIASTLRRLVTQNV